MSEQLHGNELLLDQRHFHSIVLRDTGGYSLTEYWKQLGNTVMGRQMDEITYPDFEIEHRRLRDNFPYPRGKLLEIVSASHDGSPPYFYDLFALRIKYGRSTYFVFAFPFAALGRVIVDNLINNHGLRKRCDILKVQLSVLVQHERRSEESGQLRTKVVGLHVVIPGDPLLTSLTLGGDNPMGSTLYRDYLQEPIQKGQSTLEECVLACELEQSTDKPAKALEVERHLRSRMHMDQFGNFKFYVHVRGGNLVIIPHLLKKLISLNCLDRASQNPLNRAKEELESQ